MPSVLNVSNNSVNVNPYVNLYVYNATSTGSTFTYTLPLITTNGMRFKFVRNDIDSTSSLTIQSTSPDLIQVDAYGSAASSSYSLDISSEAVFISLNGLWYLYVKSSNSDSNSSSSMMSSGFYDGSLTQVSYSSGTSLIVSFPYPGSNIRILKSVYIRLFNSTTTTTFDVKRGDGVSVLTAPVVTPITPIGTRGYVNINNINTANLPTGLASLNLYATTSNNNNLRIYSVIFR